MLLAMVTLGASAIQGLLGFGFTLVALSFFLIIVGSDAVQLIIVINLVTTFVLAIPLWRHIPAGLWRYLVFGAVVGFPLGVLAYRVANLAQLQFAAGTVVVVFACLAWFNVSVIPKSVKHESARLKKWSTGVGGVSGFMATALGMPGPILILYLAGLKLEKDNIRGTTITFLAVANLVALLFHIVLFRVESKVFVQAMWLLPFAGLGTWVGHLFSARLGQNRFRHALLVLITVSGGYAVVSALV